MANKPEKTAFIEISFQFTKHTKLPIDTDVKALGLELDKIFHKYYVGLSNCEIELSEMELSLPNVKKTNNEL